MFGFFKNKHLHKRIKEMEKSLSHSFSKISEDFMSTHKKVDHHSSHTDKRFNELYGRIHHLEKLILSKLTEEAPKVEQTKQKTKKIQKQHTHLTTLTEAQRKLYGEIIGLHLESGSEWISLTDLAKQVYPGREYNKIRSTLSEFTSILEESGLLNKKIQRKKAFVKATDKGTLYLDQGRGKKLKKIVNET